MPEVQNSDDRTLVFGVMKNPVGVNGIDPARQGINPRPKFRPTKPVGLSTRNRSDYQRETDRTINAIDRIPGEPG